jgi:hypothetical protein
MRSTKYTMRESRWIGPKHYLDASQGWENEVASRLRDPDQSHWVDGLSGVAGPFRGIGVVGF